MKTVRNTAIVLGGVVVAACGSDQTGGTASTDTLSAAVAAPAAPSSLAPPSSTIDAPLASRGEELFTTRGCNACHTVGGGRLVGPDLAGVTERREFTWIISMVLNPDSMIQADSIARRLFGEYMTPMANQNLAVEEARAIYEYLRTGSN